MLDAALIAGLTYDQFWDLTIHEIYRFVRAYGKRVTHQQRMLATMTANLMNCWTKRRVTVNQLMGRPSLMGKSPEQIAEHYRSRYGEQRGATP